MVVITQLVNTKNMASPSHVSVKDLRNLFFLFHSTSDMSIVHIKCKTCVKISLIILTLNRRRDVLNVTQKRLPYAERTFKTSPKR